MSRLTIIVASTKTNGIGHQSRLPWRLPKEMAYFARVTSNAPEGQRNAVIMGRNTWESIPSKFRPLVKRVNIVISRKEDYLLASQETAPTYLSSSFEDALKRLQDNTDSIHKAFIIGGATIYSAALELPKSSSAGFVNHVLLTRILSPDFEQCDVFMPDFTSSGNWQRVSHQELCKWVGFDVPEGMQEENGVQYEYQLWAREP
ncbi:dihydrofolate reductase [Moniliophthora roreri MCA 2997]|uniref:Dihydrofolate reductase n=2 Tax=Moniliophthora roreri TaxID=221103 RepID=V2WIK8_MONRO|nr:dihydrofolate reductase [Moniliophthora roreri MCA 2997]KAI3622465.1 dihydrofolate reductase [Moniliophthora roreri]